MHMTQLELRGHIMGSIETPEALAQFIREAAGHFSRSDEGLLLGTALSCRSDLWHAHVVRDAIRETSHASENLHAVFELLSCSALLSPNQHKALARLFEWRNSYIFRTESIFRLLTSLHRRGVANCADILLPRLHWYSSAGLWLNGMLTFRVCNP